MTATQSPQVRLVGTDYLTPGDLVAAESDQWEPYRHLEVLNDELTTALTTPGDRLAVELPIRHGKSWLGTVGGCAWSLLNFPDEPVILACHTLGLARRFGRQIRTIVRHRGPEFGVYLDPASTAQAEFGLLGHPLGGFQAIGVGMTPTGTGARRLFIDDPVKDGREVRTPEQRAAMWEWYTEVLRGRVRPGGNIVLIMSRWNEDDLIGRLFSTTYATGETWRRLSIPALAVEGDLLGREPGEALCPELGYDVAELNRLALVLGPSTFAANFQGTPIAPAARMFKPENWQWCDAIPQGSVMVRWWDNAATRNAGAYTAGVLMALCPDGTLIIVDVFRDRLASADRKAAQRETAILDSARWARFAAAGRVTQGAESEGGSGGKDQAELFVTDVMAGLPAVTEGTSGLGKEVRADTFASQQGARRVFLLRRGGRPQPWAQDYIIEHRDFPRGTYKDQVDASAHAANWLLLRSPKGSSGTSLGSARPPSLGNPTSITRR